MYSLEPSHRASDNDWARLSTAVPVSTQLLVERSRRWMCQPDEVHMFAHHRPSLNHSLLCGLSAVGGLLTPVYVGPAWPISPVAAVAVWPDTPNSEATANALAVTIPTKRLLPVLLIWLPPKPGLLPHTARHI